MTRRELVELLAGPFCEEYARRTAARIGASEADIALLYATAWRTRAGSETSGVATVS